MSVLDTPRTTEGVWGPFRALLGAQGASAVLGLVFWVVVARVVPDSGVGLATAAISTQTLLGLFCSLGLGTFFVAELPGQDAGRQRPLLLRGLGVAAGLAAVVGVVVVALGPVLGGALGEALSDPRRAAVFVLGAVAAVGVAILDEAVLGLRRSGVQVTRNLVASSLRFPLAAALLAWGARDALTLQVCWVLPLLVSMAVAWRSLRLAPAADGPSLREDVAAHGAAAWHHYRLNLAVAAATQLVPVAAAITLGTDENAVFAIAWLLATFAFMPPYLLAVSLFAHGAGVGPEELRHTMRQTIVVSLGLSLVICSGAWALGRPVLGIFGGSYAEESYQVLALLVPAGLWMVVKDHLVALWRSEKRFALATGLAAVAVVLELAGAATGGVLGGAPGLAVGWLVGMGVQAVVLAPFARSLLSTTRGEDGRTVTAMGMTLVGLVVAGLLAGSVVRAVLEDDPADSQGSALQLCRPSPDRPGPLIDLGVNTSTGVASRPHRSTERVAQLVQAADDAGADVISTTVSWAGLQPSADSPIDFRGLDRLLAATEERGLKVRIRLIHTPAWALDDPDPEMAPWQPPTSLDELLRWKAFVGAVMRHVNGRVDYVEVWTEPNQAATWPTGPSPLGFKRLLISTYNAVKAEDPDALVISGGIAGNDIGYTRALADELGPERPMDLLGVDPYSDLPPMTDEDLRGRNDFGVYDGAFEGYREVDDVMPRMPVYVSEVGWSTDTVTDEQRAGFVGEALDLLTCTPQVRVVSWYHLHPTPYDPAAWALLDARLRPNATFGALRDWTTDRDTRVRGDEEPS